MQTHLVGGGKCVIALRYRSETVSQFSHGISALLSSRTPAPVPPCLSPKTPPQNALRFQRTTCSVSTPSPRSPATALVPVGTPCPLSPGRAPRPVLLRRGLAGGLTAGAANPRRTRAAREGSSRPPAAQRRGPVCTSTNIRDTCPLLPTRRELPPRGHSGSPSPAGPGL